MDMVYRVSSVSADCIFEHLATFLHHEVNELFKLKIFL